MRALILTADGARSALSGARALGNSGWSVDVATPGRHPLVGASRFVGSTHRVPWPEHGLEDFAAAVGHVAEARGSEVVMAAGDDWLAGLAAVRDHLPVTVAHPDSTAVDRLLDKLALPQLGAVAGLRVPRTVPASDETLGDLDLPAVIKSRRHWIPGMDDPQERLEAAIVTSPAQARQRAGEIRRAGGEPLVQERIRGSLAAVSGVTDGSELTGIVQQVALQTWPEPVGVSSRAVTVPPDAHLVRGVRGLLRELRWSGIFQAQFMLPPRGGQPCLIDVNGRLYGSVSLAVAAGSDLPSASAELARHGRLPYVPDGRPGVCYLWAEGELRRRLASRGRSTTGPRPDATPACTDRVYGLWSAHDPVPAVVHAAQLCGRALRKLPTGRHP